MSTVFADSFAHYNTAGIPLKYSVAGGSIQSDPAHVRTGTQSLRVQAGDAPAIENFFLPPDITQTWTFAPQFYGFTVMAAYQTEALDGVVFSVWTGLSILPAPAEQQLALSLNADGSLSLLDGSNAEIARSAAGVITTGEFYYIRLSFDLPDPSFPIIGTAVVNVTTAGNVSTDVITASGYSTSQLVMDQIRLGGPAAPNFAYVNDLYCAATSDPAGLPFAPNIYAGAVIADGTPLDWNFSNFGSWQPVGSAHAGLVDSIPQDESQGIQFQASPQYAPDPPHFIANVSEVYKIDTAPLPPTRPLFCVQPLFLWEYGPDQISAVTTQVVAVFVQNGDGLNPQVQDVPGFVTPTPNFPFAFVKGSYDQDVFSGNAWDIDQWIAGVFEVGPGTITTA